MLSQIKEETLLCVDDTDIQTDKTDEPLELIEREKEPPKKQSLRSRLPKFSDETQRRAGKNLLRFFALILLLTLVVRGTAGASLPRVTVAAATRGEIVEKISGQGIVSADGTQTLLAPDDLTLKEVLVGAGQTVQPGDPIARFDTAEVADKLARQTAALKEMRLKLQKLERGEPTDTSGVDAAKRALDRAQSDYDAARSQGEAAVASAQAALTAAETNEQQKQAAYEAAPADQKAAAEQEWRAAQEATQTARTALSTAQADAQSNLDNTARALEDAKAALAGAEATQRSAAQQAADAAAQNSIDASVLRLDIEKQQKLVAGLQALRDADGVMLADKDGTVTETASPGAVTAGTAIVHMVDDTSTFEAELTVTKQQAQKLTVGAACDVTAGGSSMYYHPIATGTISHIGTPDENGKVTVTVRLPQGEWKQGQSVDIQAVQSRQTYEVCVPLSALRSDAQGYYVYVLQQTQTVLGSENTVALVRVSVEALDDTMAAVSGPIGPEDKIITGSSKIINAGDSVRVQE